MGLEVSQETWNREGWALSGAREGRGVCFWMRGAESLVLTPHASGYRLESGMQNLNIHTKTTSGYSGDCPGSWGRRAGPPGGGVSGRCWAQKGMTDKGKK